MNDKVFAVKINAILEDGSEVNDVTGELSVIKECIN